MSECLSLEVQDLLPEFAADLLDDAASVAVSAHLASCAVCQGDLDVLRQVRAVGVAMPTIDTGRMAAAVVTASRGARAASTTAADTVRPTLRVIEGGTRQIAAAPSTQPRQSWRRTRGWQMAAVLMLCVSGGLITTVAHREGRGVEIAGRAHATRSSDPVVSPSATGAVRGSGATVSYGDLSDYSEGELETMIATLDGWDGAARAEPVAFEPVMAPAGGSGR